MRSLRTFRVNPLSYRHGMRMEALGGREHINSNQVQKMPPKKHTFSKPVCRTRRDVSLDNDTGGTIVLNFDLRGKRVYLVDRRGTLTREVPSASDVRLAAPDPAEVPEHDTVRCRVRSHLKYRRSTAVFRVYDGS